MKIALVGATGLVGTEMLKLLDEMNIPVTELYLVASEKSIGKQIDWKGKSYPIISMQDAIDAVADFALFSAGGKVSEMFAPLFAQKGTIVIDNSSAWRMHPDVPLVVPEINIDSVQGAKIIANPNCSTIQMVMALASIHQKYKIQRLIITTFQSVSGTGKNALNQLDAESKGETASMVYPHPIFENCIPQCDVFTENDYTKEEMKMVNETRKILGDPNIAITATCVRVPVRVGHSESVNIELQKPFNIADIRELLSATKGIIVMDDNSRAHYPTALFAEGKNEVFVGRIRQDISHPQSLSMWIVADNLRKGAATNAVQIIEALTHIPA